MKRSAQLKSLRDTLRHALNAFAREHPLHHDEACSSMVASVDYLLRAAATHEGCRLSFLAYAYWQEWHDYIDGAAGDSKEFRMGAEEMEENVAASLCQAMPETWMGCDDDEEGGAA